MCKLHWLVLFEILVAKKILLLFNLVQKDGQSFISFNYLSIDVTFSSKLCKLRSKKLQLFHEKALRLIFSLPALLSPRSNSHWFWSLRRQKAFLSSSSGSTSGVCGFCFESWEVDHESRGEVCSIKLQPASVDDNCGSRYIFGRWGHLQAGIC